MNIDIRAKEISEFLNKDLNATKERLAKGFHYNHHLVAEDFISKNVDVDNSDQLLHWYRTSDAYIWELSAYHLEPGFNYSGMCEGIALGLANAQKKNVLSLGDGIGDLSMRIDEAGLSATYHDLENSLTANFAQFRFKKNNRPNIRTLFTNNWNPTLGNSNFDAVVALDFFEHLVNVEDWTKAVFNCLVSGGVFIAQNAFGIGDAEHGNSIPMHLSVNNRFEKDWAPMLVDIGFIVDPNSGWWAKP